MPHATDPACELSPFHDRMTAAATAEAGSAVPPFDPPPPAAQPADGPGDRLKASGRGKALDGETRLVNSNPGWFTEGSVDAAARGDIQR